MTTPSDSAELQVRRATLLRRRGWVPGTTPWWQGATDCPRPLRTLLRCPSRNGGVGFRCDRHRWHRRSHRADRNGTFRSMSRDTWGCAMPDTTRDTAAYASRMTTRYCTARKIITRTVIVPPEGGRYAPLPAEPTREEVVHCEANRSDEHLCIGPVQDHGKVHMCRCGWTWHV